MVNPHSTERRPLITTMSIIRYFSILRMRVVEIDTDKGSLKTLDACNARIYILAMFSSECLIITNDVGIAINKLFFLRFN